jgi:hypothetical protein
MIDLTTIQTFPADSKLIAEIANIKSQNAKLVNTNSGLKKAVAAITIIAGIGITYLILKNKNDEAERRKQKSRL